MLICNNASEIIDVKKTLSFEKIDDIIRNAEAQIEQVSGMEVFLTLNIKKGDDVELRDKVIYSVCNALKLSYAQLTMGKQNSNRMIACFFLFKKTSLNKSQIADLFGIDHTTVIHAINIITEFIKHRDEKTLNQVALIENELNGQHSNSGHMDPLPFAEVKTLFKKKTCDPIKNKIIKNPTEEDEEIRIFERPKAVYSNTTPYGIAQKGI